MTVGRLPFTLDPLPGEAFETWLHTYAARLDVTTGQLIESLDLPGLRADLLRGRWQRPDPTENTIAALGAATGLATQAVRAMFDAPGHTPPHGTLIAWAPQPVSRFCPACLADGRWRPDWRLRLQFFCHRHHAPLTERCPGCRRPPPALPVRPSLWPGSTPQGASPSAASADCRCGHDLAVIASPGCRDPDAAAAAQQFIDDLLTGIRDPDRTPGARQDALDTLGDLSLIAAHVAAARPDKQIAVTTTVLRADTLIPAVTVLGRRDETTPDPLIDLVATCTPSRRAHKAVPHTWGNGSPTLRTRIAYGRSGSLTAIDRLRHATALPTTLRLPHRAPGRVDPAVERAARLPDQIWPTWAIRLGPDTAALQATTFRTSALVALLLPHSNLPLKKQIIGLVNPEIKANTVAHHMVRLLSMPAGETALRILTELAFAIDDHDIPIDYPRRRRLVTSTELINDGTWKDIARPRSGRGRHTVNARRYLYELLTGGNLSIAPPPHQHTSAAIKSDQYRTFVTLMTADIHDALQQHALRLLESAGITDEPLTWEPPASWITTTDWPGTDPDHTDPAAIHHAILEGRMPVHQVAADLGVCIEHVHTVLHRHPLPRPGNPLPTQLRTVLPPDTTSSKPAKAFRVDPDWLREEYLTWRRSLPDIADEIGCGLSTLRAFAHAHDIHIRPGIDTHDFIDRHATGGRHPSQFPQPLRDALRGLGARRRLERFVTLANQPSINQAARAHGCSSANLTTQLATLERASGGPLIQRRPRPLPVGPLTPLGQDLCRQAQEHLGISPILPST
ncbi:TniQ family protein [Promicromonospora sp. NPDC023987]|uniref:TniQ family protein n=1 Tax=Promicromonospora sp. NPDC023987 TaxID=3155360 RepID=UPI0033FC8C22